MPTPRPAESRDEWLDRCMGDAEAVADFPDADQRYAVCISKWEGKKSMEIKSLALELKSDDEGMVEGYGSVFGGVDSYGDTIEPGAFASSIAKRKPKMLWQHRMDKPIGVWDEVIEDGKGLRLKGRIADIELGREARQLIQMGAMDGLSIGYRTLQDEMRGNNRILKQVDLWEVSFVTIPADAAATVTGIKSIATERDCEDALRDMGFSRREAKAFVARGWGGIRNLRDADAGLPDENLRDAEAIKTQLATLLERIGK
jgi:HK97 family phage prohead protease